MDVCDIKVKRIFKLVNNSSALKAYADIIVNDCFLIKGLRVVEGKKGFFVTMPQEKGKDSKWFESVRCLNKEIWGHIAEKVLSVYHEEAALA